MKIKCTSCETHPFQIKTCWHVSWYICRHIFIFSDMYVYIYILMQMIRILTYALALFSDIPWDVFWQFFWHVPWYFIRLISCHILPYILKSRCESCSSLFTALLFVKCPDIYNDILYVWWRFYHISICILIWFLLNIFK
jgi:hypothetical protein